MFLTIEELKALEIGDWVWIAWRLCGSYAMKMGQSNDCLIYQTITKQSKLNYADYGTKWLAYKNKEEANA